MDERLSHLVRDYQAAVRQAVDLMVRSGIPQPESNLHWALTDIPQLGEFVDGIRYYKHGYGCCVYLPTGAVDFDFGQNGETDGFDPWRLIRFAEDRLASYGFASEDELESVFEMAVRNGDLVYSGYILYYCHSKWTSAILGAAIYGNRRESMN